MSLLAPIICDNGTGYSKVGYVRYACLRFERLIIDVSSFAGNSDPSLSVLYLIFALISDAFHQRIPNSHRDSRICRSIQQIGTCSACKAWQSRLEARSRRPRLLHRRRGPCQCKDARIRSLLPNSPWPDRQLGLHGTLLGTDDLQVPPR